MKRPAADVNPWEGKSEEELWRIYRRTHDQKVRDWFVRQYAPLVKVP